MSPTSFDDVEDCVDAILDRLGSDIVVGTPIGVGKPNHVLNELVSRAVDDPDVDLEIWTALSLSTPDPDSELERRLVEPIADRLFGDYPDLVYDELLQRGELPENVEVHQFYFQPGKFLQNPEAQQRYHSVNYTHALRTFEAAEPNLLLQLVGVGEHEGERHFNIGSNTDVSVDLVESMRDERDAEGRDCMIVGQVNRNMPFMYGEAPVPEEVFDAVLDADRYDYPLFGPPNEPVSLVDHAIGLRVSSLLRDGGTLQIGIGSLGDAIAWATRVRHRDNDTYRALVDALDGRARAGGLVEECGGLAPFEEGLYGATEMLVEGFLHLHEAGVLSREVYDDEAVQRLANDDVEVGDGDAIDVLLQEGAISERLDADDVAYLTEWGVFRPAVEYDDGTLRVDGTSMAADLGDEDARDAIEAHALGGDLRGGTVLDGAFFVGSPEFYESLREMDDHSLRKIRMRSVRFTNSLAGGGALKRLQRRDARYVNTAMKATVTGGVVSDGLEDGRVLSGVGGQFDFVNQAHELEGGRSIVMVRSTRTSGGEVESNVVWNYGHLTIPRHLRDVVVTEYGVADLRGRSDAEVVAELVKVADSRFQDELVEEAKSAGKLPEEWTVPERYRHNYPERLETALEPFRERDALPRFPFGTSLTDEEAGLARALRGLESDVEARNVRELASLRNARKTARIPDDARPYLRRMGLQRPSTLREHALQRAVVLALASEGVV